MKIARIEPPRRFTTGTHGDIDISVCAEIHLDPGELVTFRLPDASHDVVRTSWGLYATPSLNSRLPAEGFRPAFVLGSTGKAFVLLMAHGSETDFERYLEREALKLVCWLDDEAAIAQIVRATSVET